MSNVSNLPKILFIVTQSDLGGAQRYVLNLAKNLAGQFNVMVAAGPDGGNRLFEECQKNNLPYLLITNLRREIKPLADARAVKEIRALVREIKPDIVHSNSSKAGVLTGLALIGLKNKPKQVYTAHGWVFLEPMSAGKRRLFLAMEKLAGRRRDATIVLSEKERDVAVKEKIARPEKIHVIPLGVVPYSHDRRNSRHVLQSLGIPSDAILIGCVANFFPAKNLPALVAAFKNIADNFPSAHLVIIGDGQGRPELEDRARGLTSRIHLPGYRADARELMDGFDLFVLPSVKEGLPFTLLEAMEAGLPCLVTKVGGIPEVIVDGQNGWLTEPKNLELALRRALNNQKLWPEIGAQAAITVHQKFSAQAWSDKTISLYRRLLA